MSMPARPGTSASPRPPPLRRPPGRAFAAVRISRKVQATPAVTSLWLVPRGRGCPSRSAAGTVHNAAADSRPKRRARPAHLLAIGPAGCWRVPGQRKARTRWDRQHVHPRRAIGGGDPAKSLRHGGTFTLRAGDLPVVFLSAGIGVTPVLAMLYALAAQRSKREVWWLHGSRNAADDAFAAEAQELLSQLPTARSHICYSQPGPEDAVGDAGVSAGRLSTELIAELSVPRQADVYLCGQPAFMAELGAGLVGLGFAPSGVRTETFGRLRRSHLASPPAAPKHRTSRRGVMVAAQQ